MDVKFLNWHIIMGCSIQALKTDQIQSNGSILKSQKHTTTTTITWDWFILYTSYFEFDFGMAYLGWPSHMISNKSEESWNIPCLALASLLSVHTCSTSWEKCLFKDEANWTLPVLADKDVPAMSLLLTLLKQHLSVLTLRLVYSYHMRFWSGKYMSEMI